MFYGLHLTPNLVLALAIFAHLCEMFVGVHLLVELFHHFYTLCLAGTSNIICFIQFIGEGGM